VHESYLDHLERTGVVINYRLSFLETTHRGRILDVNLHGWVATASGGRLYVNELLSVIDGSSPPAVQTREYAYHGYVVFSANAGQDLFRYDNCHGDTSTLHRHCFDVEGREVANRPVGIEQMPSLSEAIRQAEDYAAFLQGD
jgi:hypothetical protein